MIPRVYKLIRHGNPDVFGDMVSKEVLTGSWGLLGPPLWSGTHYVQALVWNQNQKDAEPEFVPAPV